MVNTNVSNLFSIYTQGKDIKEAIIYLLFQVENISVDL